MGMWPKRASKNRRLGREFVLDVKLRSSQVRARRVRTLAVVLGGLFVAIASVCLAWRATNWALNLLLYDNKAFAITEIDVQTDGMIAPDQIRRWSGIHVGQNLFALDLPTVRGNLELVSIIQFVGVEKVLPHTVRLRVSEREPLASFSLARPKAAGGFELAPYYLDSDGVVIIPPSPAQCSAASPPPTADQLPCIIGIHPGEVQPGHRLQSPQVRAALDLILAFQRSSVQTVADLATVDTSALDALVARTSQGSEVTFGLTGLDQQMLRWQTIIEKGREMNKALATLDLAVSNSIPATWVESSIVSQAGVRLPKPLRTRKKHV